MKLIVRGLLPYEITRIGSGLVRAYGLSDEVAAWMENEWGERILRRPGFDASMSRVGILHEQIVSHTMVEFHTLRYGTARIKVAGIGKIYTERGFRHRGYAGEVLRDALTYAIEGGAQIALLNSNVPGYYSKYGFMPVFPYYYATFKTDELAQRAMPLTVRPAENRDIPHIAALFERHWGARVTFTRSPQIWVWRVAEGDDRRKAMVIVDKQNEIQGYYASRDLTTDKVEVVVDTPQAAQTVLSFIGKMHTEAGEDEMTWLVPPDDVLIDYARRDVSVRVSAHFAPDSGWMARLLDAKSLFDRIMPELIEQGKFMFPGLKRDALTLNYTRTGVEIGLRNQPATYATIQPQDFIQVMFGSLSPTTLGLRANLTPESIRVLSALFPPRVAALGNWDWF